ncbi:uncharacterized protein BDW43DRAFT_311297 [Aspergillus alliaceus]|uniref:uncharacterized protein n=1 Tax=Petromyces alliaceus TaxID=209559 RepID=UPI0012A445BA|nr:uncharacterized protein BDW43DRAFT_311297 [Aspergillus alliaceus]KAB8233222.1 hypothetical protein BDW43DRAFT_311297 [Aspergillus alliaceus]
MSTSKVKPSTAANYVYGRTYFSDAYIADTLNHAGIANYVSHATTLSCYGLAPMSEHAEIVVPDNLLSQAYDALRRARFKRCDDKDKCLEKCPKGSRPKPSIHLHFRKGEGRVDLFKHSTHFKFMPEPTVRQPEDGDRNYMLLSDNRLPALDDYPFAPLITSLPQFESPADRTCGRRLPFFGPVQIPKVDRSVSAWGYEFYQVAKNLAKIEASLRRCKDEGVKRSLEKKHDAGMNDAWCWFVYINSIAWLYRHHQNESIKGYPLSWNQLLRDVDQRLVPWLDNWTRDYLMRGEDDNERFKRCLEDTKSLAWEQRVHRPS